jgi:hypothetical protein
MVRLDGVWVNCGGRSASRNPTFRIQTPNGYSLLDLHPNGGITARDRSDNNAVFQSGLSN